MPDNFQLINLDAIKSASVTQVPYPYTVISDSLVKAQAPQIQQDYPKIEDAGSFPLRSLSYGPHFAQLVKELESEAFRKVIEEKFAVDLTGRPVVITVRGKADYKDGRIHADMKTKLVTVLLYMNDDWDTQDGKLRLLYDDKNLDHYAQEISPQFGTMLLFKVVPHGWHGHKRFIGTRKVVQLNYMSHEGALKSQASRHSISATFKKWRRKLINNVVLLFKKPV